MIQENVLELKNTIKYYKGFGGFRKVLAVDNVSFTLKKGEIYGLLGPNGSGKTTLMKMIIGLLFPTKGTIRIFGTPADSVSVKARVGYLPEEAYLYRFLNAVETLEVYAGFNAMNKKERCSRINETLKVVGLDHVSKRLSRHYSKGMSRRLGLAQVLLKDADLIVLDEPTLGLDPIGARQIKDIILDLKQKGKTILFSSHMLSEVEMICDRIGIINRGRLLASDSLDNLLEKKDAWAFVLEGFNIKDRERLEAMILKEFASKIVTTSRPRETMEKLFIKIISGDSN